MNGKDTMQNERHRLPPLPPLPLCLLAAVLGAVPALAQDVQPAPAPPGPQTEPRPVAQPVMQPAAQVPITALRIESSASLLASPQAAALTRVTDTAPHALRSMSMFAIAPAEARIFHEHDLIQIIVRETTSARHSQETETEKSVNFNGAVTAWPDLQLANLIAGQIKAGDTTELPAVGFAFDKDFEGEGEYERRDDFSARLTAEVIQILPNGNLVLESRTRMQNDDEEFVLKVTGISRPEDVTPANTVLSNQLHDLRVEKVNAGVVKDANEKGLFTKLLDILFAF